MLSFCLHISPYFSLIRKKNSRLPLSACVGYRLLSDSPAFSSHCYIGVIQVSGLGCDRASRSERPESHWTRQKCSAAPANTLPPWPSVDEPFLLQLTRFSSLPFKPGCCSICWRCQHNNGEIYLKLASFFSNADLTSEFNTDKVKRREKIFTTSFFCRHLKKRKQRKLMIVFCFITIVRVGHCFDG